MTGAASGWAGGGSFCLDLGLDVDVGVELIDGEEAELLLDVLVLEDLSVLLENWPESRTSV